MTRFIYILFFILIGIILTPTNSYACGGKSNETELIYNWNNKVEINKNACCNEEKGQCIRHGKDCDGKCANSSCHCPTNHPIFIVPFFTQIYQVKLIFRKPNYYYQENYYSSAIHSIWLPPKIG
ncbi:MAG: hypothetical protein V4622_14690 [Bacteroidota bacterium]